MPLLTYVLLQNPPDTWQGTFPFTLGTQIGLISGFFRLLQQVTTPGTSGGSIPTFSGTIGGTTIDGTVIWTCVAVGALVDPYPSVWLVPPDWNNGDNTVEVFGAGSSGGSNASAGGGGGAAYSSQPDITLTPGALIDYTVGVSEVTGPGGDSWFGAVTYAASLVAAKGGQASGSAGPGIGGDKSLGIGTTRIGGGAGGAASGGVFTDGGGGGGGAAGRDGNANAGPVGGIGGVGGNVGGGDGGLGGKADADTGGGPGGFGIGLGGFPFGGGGGAGGGGFGTASGTTGDGGVPGGGGGGGSFFAGASVGGNGLIVISYSQLPVIPGAWLVVNEPPTGSPATGGGLTDRSKFLFLGSGAQHRFNSQIRQRGNATYTLVSDPEDPASAPANYLPTLFQPIYLFDENNPSTNWPGSTDGWTLVFTGLIQDFTVRYVGTGGLRYIDCSAVSLEQVFDTVYAEPAQYVNQTCGFIVADLFNRFETGSPVSLGTISAGATVPLFNAQLGDKLSDLFDQLAQTSGFVWGVDPQTQQLYFCLPGTTSAPFSLTSTQALWDTISDKTDGADYRNRQAVKLSFDALPLSSEFFTAYGTQSFTLMRPVQQVTNAYYTSSTCNTATGAFSGQPSAGDTITTGPASGSWIATHNYGLGDVIVVDGFVQEVTVAGTSGGGPQPTFSEVAGGITGDFTVVWTCQGPLGLSTGSDTYTFVTSLDNTQFGEVLIGATLAATVANLVDAINAKAPYNGTPATQGKGLTFSLPTWENSQINAISVTGSGFTAQQKYAGSGWVAALSTTSSAFAWSAPQTSGGTSPQTSVLPNQGATVAIAVYSSGTSTAAPGLSYVEGSAVVTLATPLPNNVNLVIGYTRTDGNVIEVEDTALVTALATASHGSGKIQQLTDQSSTGLISTTTAGGLQFAQEALAAYDIPPTELEVKFYQPGLQPGQLLTLALTKGPQVSLNGTYFVEEVGGELVPTFPWLDNPNAVGAGHYRYTAKLIDVAQIASYLDFWEGLGGGSGGGGGGAALVATSGGGQSMVSTTPVTGGVNEQSGNYAAVAGDSGKLITFNANTVVTLTLPSPPVSAQWNVFVQAIGAKTVVNVAASGLTVDGLTPSDAQLRPFQGLYITTDGANYFTSRSPRLGFTQSHTANTAATFLQNGQLQLFNSASALVYTLASPPPFETWSVFLQCEGAGGLTINPNGLTIDGSGSSLVLTQGQGVIIFTDGTNYFTMRGIGGSTSPGGSNPQVQYNNSGAFGGIAGATSDGTNLLVTTQASGDSSTKAASTAFVAAALSGINPAVAVQAATTAAGNTSGFTYNNGVGGIGATFTGSVNTAVTIDGFTFTALGQRLLVKNDTQSPSGAFNGVYYVTQLQTALLAPILTRALDYDQPSDINNTGAIPVINGTVNGSTSWVLTTQVATIGTDPLTYAQFSYNPSTVVQTSRNINTTAPLTGGGNLSADRTLGVSAATSSALGVVQPDGTIITVSAGAITVPKASGSAFGVVEVDGTTITSASGVISAVGGASPPGLVQLAQTVLGSPAAAVSFATISGAYTSLLLVITARSSAAAEVDNVKVVANTDTAAHYSANLLYSIATGTGATPTAARNFGVIPATAAPSTISAASATAGQAGNVTAEFPSYSGSTFFKTAIFKSMQKDATPESYMIVTGWEWASTAAITQLDLTLTSGGNFVTGSTFTLYGLK